MLSIATRSGTVSMLVVRALVESVADTGTPKDVFLAEAELEGESLQSTEQRMPRVALYELCLLAIELTRDPAFGLHAIEHIPSDALNPVGALVVHAATLREALDSMQEFRGLLGDEASFKLEEQGDEIVVRVGEFNDARLQVQRFWTELVLAGLYRTIRRFGEASQVDAVDLAYQPPSYLAEYHRIFERKVRFGRPFSGLRFDRQLMEAVAPHPDPELHSALRGVASRRLLQLTASKSYASRVYQYLAWQTPPRDVRMGSAAHALGLSVRSLRRHLAAEGKRYRDLVSEASAVLAKAYLLEQRRSIVETARELGFADDTGFHRAFKRWTGMTPGAVNGSQRAGAPRLSK